MVGGVFIKPKKPTEYNTPSIPKKNPKMQNFENVSNRKNRKRGAREVNEFYSFDTDDSYKEQDSRESASSVTIIQSRTGNRPKAARSKPSSLVNSDPNIQDNKLKNKDVMKLNLTNKFALLMEQNDTDLSQVDLTKIFERIRASSTSESGKTPAKSNLQLSILPNPPGNSQAVVSTINSNTNTESSVTNMNTGEANDENILNNNSNNQSSGNEHIV